MARTPIAARGDDRRALAWRRLLVAIATLSVLATASSADAGRYVMLREWPTGIHEGMFEMDSRDEPDCAKFLTALNRKTDLNQRYSWLSPPERSGPVTPVRWSPVTDADKLPILKAESEADCRSAVCYFPPSFWDSDAGRKRFQDIVANNEIKFEWAKIALDGKTPPVSFIRTHRVSDENQPNAVEDRRLSNARFDALLNTAPIKVAQVGFYADIVMIDGKPLFYGYTSRSDDSHWRHLKHPQSLIEVARVDDPAQPAVAVTICQMAYQPGPHVPPGQEVSPARKARR
jgi:hypothetical protein